MKTFTGTMTFLRNESSACICCEGKHIFCRFVKTPEGKTSFWEEINQHVCDTAKEGEKVTITVSLGNPDAVPVKDRKIICEHCNSEKVVVSDENEKEVWFSCDRCNQDFPVEKTEEEQEEYYQTEKTGNLCARCGRVPATIYDAGGDICYECYSAELK
jgi:hypothetical protein